MRKRGSCQSAAQDRIITDECHHIKIALRVLLSVLLYPVYGDSVTKTFSEDNNGRQEGRLSRAWNWRL